MATTTPYEALVQSASRLTDTDALADGDDSNISDASRFIQRNRTALEAARRALNQRCAVPLRFELTFLSDHCDDFGHLRNLARAFRAEASLAASAGDYRVAAAVGIDMLELANAARRGGLVIDLLVSIAIAGMAMETLRKMRDKLDDATRRQLILALQRLENEREPFADIVARDREWELATGCEDEPCDFANEPLCDPAECGLSEDQQRVILQFIQHVASLPESEQRSMQLDQDRHMLALMRMLSVDLALRSWYATSSSFPDDLALPTPDFLAQLPVDPFTDAPFIYRRAADGSFCLYSTGPKAFDGGGVFGPWLQVAVGNADLCLDECDYLPECCTMPDGQGREPPS